MAASRALREARQHPGEKAYFAEGGSVDKRQQDFENALNYEMHADGDSVGNDPHWIEHADINKGGLHRALHISPDKKIPQNRLDQTEHSRNPHMRKMAQFAENVRR